MSALLDPQQTDNLRRWQESGQPQAWVDARGGQWAHADWLTLLGNLRHSEFWPLDPAAVRALLDRVRGERLEFHRLVQSGAARRWVESRQGEWGQPEWLGVLQALRDAGFSPIRADDVRALLDGLTREWHNVRRWEGCGEPRRWAAVRGGEWSHQDWLALVQALRQSEFWPLDLRAVGEALEVQKAYHANLRRWVASGWPRRWVEAQRGRWTDDAWAALVEALRWSAYWPLDLDSVGQTLEDIRRKWLNLGRWERSGQPREWIATRRGQWAHDDWLALLDRLGRSEFWPLDLDEVGRVLAEIQQEWQNVRRWHQSGEAWRWVEARRGLWGREDWLALLAVLQASSFGPIDPAAAEEAMRQVTAEWWNLRYWRETGQPRLWVAARQGRWEHEDWLALLVTLRRSPYWPQDPERVGAALDQAQREYENLSRWKASGQPRRWVGARGGQWGEGDWQALLAELQASAFWPLDPAAVGWVLEEARAEIGQAESGAAPRGVGTSPAPLAA